MGKDWTGEEEPCSLGPWKSGVICQGKGARLKTWHTADSIAQALLRRDGGTGPTGLQAEDCTDLPNPQEAALEMGKLQLKGGGGCVF